MSEDIKIFYIRTKKIAKCVIWLGKLNAKAIQKLYNNEIDLDKRS